MPEVQTPRRRPLKVQLDEERLLELAVRSLERIADGLTSVVETIDALVVEDNDGTKRLRVTK